MGQGMAQRIFDAGHDLVVYNRTREKAAALGKVGARIADSIPAVAKDRDVVITMLTDDTALVDVAKRDGGLLNSLPCGVIHMAMGTHSIETMRSLSHANVQAGQVFVAAQVLGRPDRAAAGELGIIPPGPADTI